MAQGEFALVKDNVEKALLKPSPSVNTTELFAMLADIAVQQRDLDALQEYAPLIEEGAASLEHKLFIATALRARGVQHHLKGEFHEAGLRFEQAADLFGGLDTRWQLGRTYYELGRLSEDLLDESEAERHYGKALILFEEMGALPDQARVSEKLKGLSGK